MTNVYELEKRWVQYKVKSYITDKKVLFSIISILLLILFLSFSNDKSLHVENKIQNSSHVEKSIVEKEPLKDKKTTTSKSENIVIKEKVVLSPSLNFIKNIDRDKTDANKEKKSLKISKQLIKKERVVNDSKSESISFKRTATKNDIDSVIKRFNENNNPVLSLFIARKYYELGDYNKAYNYALITNRINNDIEDSWIVFAKSLVKMGKKDKAVKNSN